MLEAIFYIFICVLTGFCGKDSRIGFFGTFLFALVTTPLVVLPVLLLLRGPYHRSEQGRPQVWRPSSQRVRMRA
jgi:hypothetical protein